MSQKFNLQIDDGVPAKSALTILNHYLDSDWANEVRIVRIRIYPMTNSIELFLVVYVEIEEHPAYERTEIDLFDPDTLELII